MTTCNFIPTIFLLLCIFRIAVSFPIQQQNPEQNGPYFQGDIIPSSGPYSGRIEARLRWPDRTIFYQLEPSYPTKLRSTFLQAIAYVSQRTCVKFQPASTSTPDYVLVTATASSACYSYVGRQGGPQTLSLPESCHNLGTFVHELIHVIGFHHEHSRPDRDEHIKILWENVQPGKEIQFRVFNSSTVSSYGVPYDYGSIMHYDSFAFSKAKNELKTIKPLVNLPKGVELGQRKEMSKYDVMKVNRMYGC